MTQLTQEGAVQVFRQPGIIDSFVVGVVGSLQFDVLQYRLKQEYGVDIQMHNLPYGLARWLENQELAVNKLKGLDNCMLLEDIKERPVILIGNEWQLKWVQDRNPSVNFLLVPNSEVVSQRSETEN